MKRPHPSDLSCPVQRNPARRLYAELYCLALAFVFHGRNNHVRKAITLFLVAVWGIVTVAITLQDIPAVKPPFYAALTGLVFLIVGRMWDIEVTQFANIPIQSEREDDDE